MRILFIRHGDPDYTHDTLTEKGVREAKLLADIAHTLNLGDCYVSPLGRAQKTAEYTLRRLNIEAETCGWLQEFPAKVNVNGSPSLMAAYPDTRMENGVYVPRIAWDMVPSYLSAHPEYFDRTEWRSAEIADHSDILEVYDRVVTEFDRLLARYGYVREGMHYRVEREYGGTITCFCHFGVTSVLLAHLWNLSPFTLWHGTVLAPTSVSEIVTEEREKGIASFRGLRIGDVTHLYLGGEEPSFSARFCELYSNTQQRH